MSAANQPHAPSPWRAAPYLVAAFLVALSISLPAPALSRAVDPPAEPARAALWEADGVALHGIGVSGAPEQMGYQQGRRLQDDIRAAVADAWRRCLAGRAGGWRTCRERAALLGRALPASLLAEARGLASGAGVTESDILLLNSMIAAPAGDGPPAVAGLAVWGQAALDAAPLLGAILGPADGVADIWVARQPAGARPTLLLGRPGWLGGIAGVHAEGLIALALLLPCADLNDAGLPAPITLRLALEAAQTPEEALVAAMGLPHAGGAQLFFAHPRQGIVGLEFSARRQRRMASELDTLASAGLFHDAALGVTQTTLLTPDALAEAQARWDELERLARANVGWIGLEKLLAALGGLAQERGGTVLIFAPAQGTLWLGAAGQGGGRLLVLRPEEAFTTLRIGTPLP